jgi:hypothetical protein
MAGIPALSRLRQKDGQLEANLSYIGSLLQKNKNKNTFLIYTYRRELLSKKKIYNVF